MALDVSTLEEITNQNIANFEGQIGQQTPLNDKAFIRVLSVIEAILHTGLYKFGAERAQQNLAISASGDDLDRIGVEFGVIRKDAEPALLTGTLPGVDGTIIPITTIFTGDLNGVRYFMLSASGVVAISVQAEDVGTVGNLQIGDTLTISSQIAGAGTTLTVTQIDNTGTEREDDATYRERVLFVIRATFGGSNAADHKAWAEEVAGVARAYPYSGKPVDDPPPTSYPGDRVVYVEADAKINVDGIAPQSLLDEVRVSLNIDPVTLKSRPALGLIDDTLYVESIRRTTFDVTVRGLSATAGDEAEVKSDITFALDTYFRAIRCFVCGIDLPQLRNDFITDLTVSAVVQDVLDTYGASALEVAFGLPSALPIDEYQLEQGELSKLGAVSYVI